jgi:hypothetical protein
MIDIPGICLVHDKIYTWYISGIWQDSPNKVYVLSCWMDICLLSVRLMHRMSLSMHGDFPPKSYTVLNIAVVYDNIYHDYTWYIPRLLRFSIHCVFTSNELPPKVRASMYRCILRRGALHYRFKSMFYWAFQAIYDKFIPGICMSFPFSWTFPFQLHASGPACFH